MLTGRPPFGSRLRRRRSCSASSTIRCRRRRSCARACREAVDAVLAKALAPIAEEALGVGVDVRDRARPRARARRAARSKLPPVEPKTSRSPPRRRVLRPTAGIEDDLAGRSRSADRAVTRARARRAPARAVADPAASRRRVRAWRSSRRSIPSSRTVLSPTLAPLAWVELAELIGALDVHARSCCRAQRSPRKVGRGTMSATFARLFGADPTSLAAGDRARRAADVLVALPRLGRGRGRRPSGAAPTSRSRAIAGSTEVCALIGAELERIVELTGAQRRRRTHPTCRCIGPTPTCEFRLSWTR